MKVLVLSAVLAIALAAPYSTDNDDLDVEAIVCNPETLSKVTQCFLDKGPCSDVAAQFKSVLPDATATACSKCTPAQKHMLKRYLQQVKDTSPDDLQALREKYDPDSQHIDALVAALKDA